MEGREGFRLRAVNLRGTGARDWTRSSGTVAFLARMDSYVGEKVRTDEGRKEPGKERMDESRLLERITVNPEIFGGKPIIRGHRLAVEHVLAMLAAGDAIETILEGYPWLTREDVQACLAYARSIVAHERFEPLFTKIES